MKRHLLASAIAAGLAFATPTMAGTITYHGYDIAGPESYITISNATGVIGAATIGQIVLHNTEYGNVYAWCVDLWHDLQGSGTYNVNTGSTTLSDDLLGRIGALMAYSEGNAKTNALILPATQLAIWMLEYPDLTFWNETRDGSVAEATALLAMDMKPVYGMQELTADGNQTLLKAPEPMTVLILGSAMVGLGLARRLV